MLLSVKFPSKKNYPDPHLVSDLTTLFTLDIGLHDYLTNIKASFGKGPLVFTYSTYHKWLSDENVIR